MRTQVLLEPRVQHGSTDEVHACESRDAYAVRLSHHMEGPSFERNEVRKEHKDERADVACSFFCRTLCVTSEHEAVYIDKVEGPRTTYSPKSA